MARDNYVRIVGTAKYDSEAREIREGLMVLNFTLVVDGVGNERPTFVDCVAYDQHIVREQMEGFVEAGEEFEVEGHLTFRSFTQSNGVLRSGMVVYVDSMEERS